jgi:hypothetical protein
MKRGTHVTRLTILYLFLVAYLDGVAVAQPTPHSSSAVQLITIEPLWRIPGQPAPPMVTIRNVRGVFQRSWDAAGLAAENNVHTITFSTDDSIRQERENHVNTPKISEDVVSQDSVKMLVQALQAPALRMPELENLGITSAWLAQYADKAAKGSGTLGEVNDERQQDFFRRSFTDLNLIKSLLPHIVGSRWTDDPVWVHVSVKFANGETWIADSYAQPAFMLPWACKVAGRKMRTYNADISRAVAALMPEGTIDRDRLAGAGLEELIRRAVDDNIRTQWKMIGAEDQAGYALDLLRKRYTIRRSEVSEYNGLTFGIEPKFDLSQDASLQVDVFLAIFPKNLTVAAVFPLRQGKAIGLDSFLQNGSKYENLVLTNPWVMESLQTHTKFVACLNYDEDASLSEKAMRIFAADMHQLGRDDLVQQVTGHRDEVALLNYYGNELILFPDHHAIVWRWGKFPELFKWSSSNLKTKRCTEYNTVTEGCVAAIIKSDGSLQK